MLLSDSSIRELIKAGVLANATKANVCPISYDLLTLEFYPKDGGATELELLSGGNRFLSDPRARSACPARLPRVLQCATPAFARPRAWTPLCVSRSLG